MKRGDIIQLAIVAAYGVFLGVSFATGFSPGKEIGLNFLEFSKNLLLVLPSAFLIIGLFEVWIKKEQVARHLGKESGVRGFFWAVILASTTIGGLYVAFPAAYSLSTKGARLSVVFTYLGAAAICRIPMTVFEASFLGAKFTLIRLCVSLPLVIASSIMLEKYLEKSGFKIMEINKAK